MRIQSECSCKSKTFICTIFESVFFGHRRKDVYTYFSCFRKIRDTCYDHTLFLPVYSDGYHGGKEWVSMYDVMHFVCDLNN